MNLFAAAIVSSLNILDRRNFKKALPASHGSILFDYVNDLHKIDVPAEVSSKLWTKVVKSYSEKNKAYSQIMSVPAKDNKTIISLYKGELVRAFLYNNQVIFKELLEQIK